MLIVSAACGETYHSNTAYLLCPGIWKLQLHRNELAS